MTLERLHQSKEQTWHPYGLGLVAAILFFAIGVTTLTSYGYTWDSSENLLTGHHYVRFFQTGDEQWLNFDYWNESYLSAGSQRPLFFNRVFNAPERYPPAANIASVLTHELFSDRLGLFADPDGYHLAVLLFAALTIFVLAVFSWQAFGKIASFAATVALFTYPLFFEHAHNNIKDIPFAALVLLALWSYWLGIRGGRWPWFILSAVATGLALGIRVLAVEVWLVLGIAYVPTVWANRREKLNAFKPYKPFLIHVPVALLCFLAIWPWLWPDPIGRFVEYFTFSRNVSKGLRVLYAGQIWRSAINLPWHYTALILTYTTPIIVLIGGVIGSLAAIKRGLKHKNVAAAIMLTLFLISLLRSSVPTFPQYDGSRHMMDGIVAFVGLFGLGCQVSWDWLRERLSRPLPSYIAYILIILVFIPLIFVNMTLHPFQGIFYNTLSGGTTAVYDIYPQEYWGSSFRLGARWISQNVEPSTLVLPRVGGHLLKYYLDPELEIIPDEVIPNLSPEQDITIIYMTRRDKFDWIAKFSEANLQPVFELRRADVPLLRIVQTTAGVLQQNWP